MMIPSITQNFLVQIVMQLFEIKNTDECANLKWEQWRDQGR